MKPTTKALLAATCTLALATALSSNANAQVSGDAVKIGVLNDQSGLYADFGGRGSVIAAQMAVEDFGGKVLGKPIQVLSADHQNKPDVGSNIARQWYDQDGVDAIADLTTSSVALAVQEIGKQNGKVTMTSGAATSRLTGDACSPTGFHWAYDTVALANGTGKSVVAEGLKKWFFLTADYAFGYALEKDVSEVVKASGRRSRRIGPASAQHVGLLLLPAPGAGLRRRGDRSRQCRQDTTTSIKQAAEFGIVAGGQSLAGLLLVLSDIHALGLETAKGLVLTTGFYWDLDDESRAWSQRYYERMQRMPNMVQAGVYSSVMHYLKAVQEAGTDEGKVVAAKMKELPIKDMFARNGKVREDGRMVHDMYLARVKTPAQSKKPWDYYEIVRTIPGDQAYLPLDRSPCPLVKK